MRSLIVSCLSILFFCQAGHAQIYQPDYRDVGAKYPIDTCRVVVTYDFVYVVDTSAMRIYRDRTLLETGNRVMRYYSLYADMCDSLDYNYFKDIPPTDIQRLEGGVNTSTILPNEAIPWYCDVYTWPKERKRMVSTRFLHEEYRYDEAVEPLEWRMTERTDTVAGYLCHEAEADFRGRRWRVWFAPDLPVPEGPWKLRGLPGLILKASDADDLYCWTAIGVEQPVDRMIHDYADKALHATNRHEFIIPSHKKVTCKRRDIDRLWRRQWLAPMTMMFLDGKEHIIYDRSTQQTVKIDINDVPEGYYPKLELDI